MKYVAILLALLLITTQAFAASPVRLFNHSGGEIDILEDGVDVTIDPNSSVVTGQTKVTNADTATVLGSSTSVTEVILNTIATNSNAFVYVGGSTVTTTTGLKVASCTNTVIRTDNLADLYIVTSDPNAIVSYMGLVK